MVKKILCLLCVFVVMFSCKQTQLTSNFNKRSKKIYVKPSLRNNDIEIVLNENKTPKDSKSISREVKDTFNYNDLKPKEEFIADAGISEIKVISNENKLHQKLIGIDSILKSIDSTLIEEEILELSNQAKKISPYSLLELSNQAKKFSLYSLIAIILTLLTLILDLEFAFPFFGVLLSLSLTFLTLQYLNKIRKKLKKNKGELNKNVRRNIRTAKLISLPLGSALILGLIGFIIYIIDYIVNWTPF